MIEIDDENISFGELDNFYSEPIAILTSKKETVLSPPDERYIFSAQAYL